MFPREVKSYHAVGQLVLGGGHAAMYDAMTTGRRRPSREELVGGMADWIFSEIANVPGKEGHAALPDSIAQHPRLPWS